MNLKKANDFLFDVLMIILHVAAILGCTLFSLAIFLKIIGVVN